jgi:hypothetical protein
MGRVLRVETILHKEAHASLYARPDSGWDFLLYCFGSTAAAGAADDEEQLGTDAMHPNGDASLYHGYGGRYPACVMKTLHWRAALVTARTV